MELRALILKALSDASHVESWLQVALATQRTDQSEGGKQRRAARIVEGRRPSPGSSLRLLRVSAAAEGLS